MSPRILAHKIRSLPPKCRITMDFEDNLTDLQVWDKRDVWYSSQKEHWLGWLRQYDGPGYYGRKNPQRSAEFVYNHIGCPPMLLWLGEACRIPRQRVMEAKRAALAAGPKLAPDDIAEGIRLCSKIELWNE